MRIIEIMPPGKIAADTFNERLTATWLIAGLFFIWLNAVAVMIWPLSMLFMPIRIALVALAVIMGVVIARRPFRQMLLSPAYLLGLLFLIAYSVIPTIQFYISDYIPMMYPQFKRASDFYGSPGEILVLLFVAFCLALAAINLRWAHRGVTTPETVATHRFWTMAVVIAAVMVAIATMIPVLAEHSLPLKNFLRSRIGREIWSALAPVSSISIVTICYVGAIRKGWYLGFAISIVAAFFAVKLSTALIMIPGFIILSSLVLIGSIRYSGLRLVALLGGGTASIMVIIFLGIGIFRYSALSHTNMDSGKLLSIAIMNKAFYRQTNTAYCFNKIFSQRNTFKSSNNPFYFVTAIIPRSMWPEKPTLSRGYEFSSKYCWPDMKMEKKHSEMITLIGEPILEAGLPGIVVASAVIGVALLALGVVLSRATPLGIIGVVAMLPWLINFQQHFALYFANSVKMFLTMAPILLTLGFFARRAEKSSAVTGEAGDRS